MDLAFGTKVYDYNKNDIGILIQSYNLGYIDAPDKYGAQVLAPTGKIYAANLDSLLPICDIDEEEVKTLNIPECFLID